MLRYYVCRSILEVNLCLNLNLMLKLKRLLITISLICLTDLSAQSLSARVVDENNEALVGATVYFDGTTRGVITNINGVFNINLPDNLASPILVISYLGYETVYETDINNLKSKYQLRLQKNNLDEVNLYTQHFTREAKENAFKKYFLGTGRPGKKCEIVNMEDITLYFKIENNTLYAESLNPIIIQNDYLGYKVKFDLKAFEVKFRATSLDDIDYKLSYFAGFSFFEDINPNKFGKRIRVYQKSLNHFFRSVVTNTYNKTKFKFYYKGRKYKPKRLFKIEKLDQNIYKLSIKSKVLKLIESENSPTYFDLYYKNEYGTLKFVKPDIRVDIFGNNLDLQNLVLEGHFAGYKVAKLLPSNYILVKK